MIRLGGMGVGEKKGGDLHMGGWMADEFIRQLRHFVNCCFSI